MIFSSLERYTVGGDDRANTPVDHLAQLRQAMKFAKERYDDLQLDIKADDHALAAVARDVILAHGAYTQYRSAVAPSLH